MDNLRCRKHPKYKALRKPRAKCVTCRCMWKQAQDDA